MHGNREHRHILVDALQARRASILWALLSRRHAKESEVTITEDYADSCKLSDAMRWRYGQASDGLHVNSMLVLRMEL